MYVFLYVLSQLPIPFIKQNTLKSYVLNCNKKAIHFKYKYPNIKYTSVIILLILTADSFKYIKTVRNSIQLKERWKLSSSFKS